MGEIRLPEDLDAHMYNRAACVCTIRRALRTTALTHFRLRTSGSPHMFLSLDPLVFSSYISREECKWTMCPAVFDVLLLLL